MRKQRKAKATKPQEINAGVRLLNSIKNSKFITNLHLYHTNAFWLIKGSEVVYA